MRERRFRVNPFEAVFLERQGTQERRGDGHGMHRGTHIVEVAGEGEGLRTHAAANLVLRLQDEYGSASARENDSGGQAIWARSDNNRVVVATLLQDAPSYDERQAGTQGVAAVREPKPSEVRG